MIAAVDSRIASEWRFLREWIGPRPNLDLLPDDLRSPEVRALYAAALDDRDAPDADVYTAAAAKLGITMLDLAGVASEWAVCDPLLSPSPSHEIERMARRLRRETRESAAQRTFEDSMVDYASHRDPQRVADAAMRLVSAKADDGAAPKLVPTLADGWRDPAEAPSVRWPTGLRFVDEALGGGYMPGTTIALVAPPKLGKSAFAEQLAIKYLYANPDAKALYWSGEMPVSELQKRALAMFSQLPHRMLERTDLSPSQAEDKASGIERFLAVAPRLHVVTGEQSARGLCRAVEACGATLLVVDYLQLLLPSEQGESRRERVEATSRELCSWTAGAGVVTLAVASTTKEHARHGADPDIAGVFREAGAIGFDVSVAFYGSEDRETTRAMGDPSKVAVVWRCLGNRHDEPRDMATCFDRPRLTYRGMDRRAPGA